MNTVFCLILLITFNQVIAPSETEDGKLKKFAKTILKWNGKLNDLFNRWLIAISKVCNKIVYKPDGDTRSSVVDKMHMLAMQMKAYLNSLPDFNKLSDEEKTAAGKDLVEKVKEVRTPLWNFAKILRKQAKNPPPPITSPAASPPVIPDTNNSSGEKDDEPTAVEGEIETRLSEPLTKAEKELAEFKKRNLEWQSGDFRWYITRFVGFPIHFLWGISGAASLFFGGVAKIAHNIGIPVFPGLLKLIVAILEQFAGCLDIVLFKSDQGVSRYRWKLDGGQSWKVSKSSELKELEEVIRIFTMNSRHIEKYKEEQREKERAGRN
ncbi:hypothetical protein Ddc_13822 [Ditylenchus destructor]|nr:hypothetical protein Ddc_13822 [Ditylenchus destructor]